MVKAERYTYLENFQVGDCNYKVITLNEGAEFGDLLDAMKISYKQYGNGYYETENGKYTGRCWLVVRSEEVLLPEPSEMGVMA